jgi:imidazole glycerol-phosphate synthase subunit HisH
MKVAIVKYNAGNVQSVLYALQRLGIDAVVTDDEEQIRGADKVIFPGVGAAGTAMEYLNKKNLGEIIISLKQPVLGICLGLQLMCRVSEEGNTKCLGIFDVQVKKFDNKVLADNGSSFKIPHMGWNNIHDLKSHIFENVKENAFVYFVHSYYAELSPQTIATTDYIMPFSAAIQKDNFYGVQFHSEKSADAGIQIISNFLKLV